MKILNFKLILPLAAVVVIISNCSKDSSKTASPFIGNFVFSEAKTAAAVGIPVSTPLADSVTFTAPANTDITSAIEAALLGAISCAPLPTYIELRTDNSIYYSCQGNTPKNAGTWDWDEASATELILNLNSTAVPSSPTGIKLTISNIVTDAVGIKGETTVPLPKQMIALLLPQGVGVTLHPNAPAFFIVKFSIKFTKVSK